MHFAKLHTDWPSATFLSILLLSSFVCAHAQEGPNGGLIPRMDRPEIVVTARDQAGAMITATGTVKLYREGTPAGSAGLSRGRAFFGSVLFGSYSVII